ncbi:MAG: PAS domain S-box protein [Amaricoccus sp.]
MPETSAARLDLTIRISAFIVAGLAAGGAVLAWANQGADAAVPFLVILLVTAVAGWNAAAMASRAIRNLRIAEGRLQAAAEALPDGLVVFDRDDRVAFYNSRYPEMMTESLRQGLALGRRFEEWMREGIARGPVYHPDMGADFLDQRLARRDELHGESAFRIADGRWMRLRENRMEDGSRVLLITDITEERRRDAQLRLLALAVEQAGDPVEITGPDNVFTYVNHAFETTTGIAQAEALGREPQEILSSGEHPPAFFDAMRAQLQAGKPWQGTIVNRHRDGHLIEQETNIAPMRDESGTITHYVAVKRDVTEAHAQARALAESEARYRAVVEAQTEFIVRISPEGYWTFMNDAAERYIGMTLEEMRARGLHDYDLIVPEDRPLYADHLARITPDNPTSVVEWRGLHPDGSEHWEHWTDTGIFDAAGGLIEIQCVGREITDRKLAEVAREEAERLRLAALEAALDCYVAIDVDGNIVEFNAASERTFGYAREEAIGRPMVDLIVPPHLRAAHLRGMTHNLGKDLHHPYGRRIEVDAMRSDGSLFPIEIVVVRGDRGGAPIFLAYLRDLTERKAAERVLAEREEQFRTIAENMPLGLVISDLATQEPLFINPKARRNLGLGPDEQIASLIPFWEKPEQRETLRQAVLARGTASPVEVALRMHDGRRRKALMSATRTQYGGRDAMIVATVDVTELRETEAALQESQARLHAFMDFAPVAAHLRDVEGRYLMFNRRMEQLIGVPAEAALGRLPAEVRPPEVVGESDLHHRRVVETGEMYVTEQHLTNNLPEPRWAMAIRFPVLDAGGKVSAVGTFAVDITDRKAAEAALQASEARLNAINAANLVPMNIARLSDRKLLFVNDPYVRLYGLEGVDLDAFDRSTLYPDPSERDWLYAELAAGREVSDHEVTLRRLDGREIPVSLTSRQILFQGEPAIVTTSVDLTALRAAQAEAARSREALHQSEKLTALGALLAGVAHELNNPLSVVVGYSSMLREIGCDPEMTARVEKIHAAAERCARIVRTFLAMARARPPRREPVLLGEVVMGALELAAYGLRSADVDVTLDLPPGLPPVHGDADQLHQVVVNLVVNAQQALLGRPSPRRLAISGRAEGADVILEVTDNGPGMAADVAKRAFEPFFTTKPQGVGTGVGLSVCHGIVAAHGGRIELDTDRGKGARFRVRLPGSHAPDAARPKAAAPAVGGGRILVVDDEPEIAALLAERLGADGVTVETASSGRRALATLEASDGVDAVVTDLRMPDMDGAALADEIGRRWPGLAGRIVLITGDALGADPGGRLGARGLPIFEKPLDLAALTAELHRRMAGAGAR